MDSIHALAKVYDSLSKGASTLDFPPSDITGDCAAQVQEIVRERKSGKTTEKAISSALSCMNNGNGLGYLGLISAGMGYWKDSVRANEKALKVFEKLGDVHGAAQTYNNLGSVYLKMEKWHKAIEFYQKSLEKKEKIGDLQGAAQTYGNIGSVYVAMGEWHKAIEFCQKSLEISEKLGDVYSATPVYVNLGVVYDNMGDWTKAIKFYQKDLEISEKLGDLHAAAQTYDNFGSVYLRMGEWQKAIEFYQKSLERKEKLGDVQGAAQTYGNIGSVYYRMGEMTKSIKLYQECLERSEKLGDLLDTAAVYNNIGLVYYSMGEWHKAIEFYQKSLENQKKLGNVHGDTPTNVNLGVVYADMGEWHKAIEFFQKALEISEKLGDIHSKGIALLGIGKLHLDKKPPEPEEARKYLEESIKLLNKESRPDYPNALNWLALCYHSLGSMKKAQAKRESNIRKKEELVSSAAFLFLGASKRYAQVAGLPRVNILSLSVYSHLNMGLSYSVKNITERDEQKALNLLDNAIKEFKEALKFAEDVKYGLLGFRRNGLIKLTESLMRLSFRFSIQSFNPDDLMGQKDIVRIQGTISDHEAKRYIRLAVIEKDIKKQNEMLDNAIEALENAVKYFENVEAEKQCDINTCNGCRHLFKGLMAFREGVKENNRKKISDSVFELREAKICYAGAENELGTKTVEVLVRSFDYLEELINNKEEKSVRIITDEFIEIIDELSSVGLQRIVKALTFDESMKLKKQETFGSSGNVQFGNVSGGNINLGHVAGDMNAFGSDGKKDDKYSIPDAATLAGYSGWVVGGLLLYYGYEKSDIIALVGSVAIFIFLVARRLKKR